MDLGDVRTLGRKLNPRLSILDSGWTCARLVESVQDNSSRWNKSRHREAPESLCKRSVTALGGQLSVATVDAVPHSTCYIDPALSDHTLAVCSMRKHGIRLS